MFSLQMKKPLVLAAVLFGAAAGFAPVVASANPVVFVAKCAKYHHDTTTGKLIREPGFSTGQGNTEAAAIQQAIESAGGMGHEAAQPCSVSRD